IRCLARATAGKRMAWSRDIGGQAPVPNRSSARTSQRRESAAHASTRGRRRGRRRGGSRRPMPPAGVAGCRGRAWTGSGGTAGRGCSLAGPLSALGLGAAHLELVFGGAVVVGGPAAGRCTAGHGAEPARLTDNEN